MDVLLAPNQREHQQRDLNTCTLPHTPTHTHTHTRSELHCAYLCYCPVRYLYAKLSPRCVFLCVCLCVCGYLRHSRAFFRHPPSCQTCRSVMTGSHRETPLCETHTHITLCVCVCVCGCVCVCVCVCVHSKKINK